MNAQCLYRYVLPLLISLMPFASIAQNDVKQIFIQNEFIRIVANAGPGEAGRFSIKTTGGDPSRPESKNQHLIFGGENPWTSYTTLAIDGVNYAFGGATKRRAGATAQYGAVQQAPTIVNDQIVAVSRYGDIEVTQSLSFSRGPSTRMLDTANITYRIINKGGKSHQIGLRLLLDTMCGSNDGAPIRAGAKAFVKPGVLSGQDIPDFWQAFDRLANPTVVSQGTMHGAKATPPDKVIFADWGLLADDNWMPVITDNLTFIRKGEDEVDTAAALFWEANELEPGQTRTITTYYGLGEVTLKPGQLTLGLTHPAETTFEYERTQRFTIVGYVQNTGGFDARDVQLELQLPKGLKLVSGDDLLSQEELVKADDTLQRSWIIEADGSAGGNLPLSFTIKSANIEPNTLEKVMNVIVPVPTIHLLPGKQSVPVKENGLPKIIPILVNLSPAENFYGMRCIIRFDSQVIRPLDVSRGHAFVEGDRLLSGWKIDMSQPGIIIMSGRRTDAMPLTQAETNLARITFRSVGEGTSQIRVDNQIIFNEKGVERTVEMIPATIEITPVP